MALDRGFTHSGSYGKKLDLDGLVWLQRPARHRGFSRDLLSHPTLAKFPPTNGCPYDAPLFRLIEDRTEGAKLDAPTLDYPMRSAETELSSARSQRA